MKMAHVPLGILGIAGVLAGIATAVSLAGTSIDTCGRACVEWDYDAETAIALVGATLFLLLPAALLTYAFRVIGIRPDADRWRVEMALGASRDSIVTAELLRGLRHGAAAGGIGLAWGIAATLANPGVRPENLSGAALALAMYSFGFLVVLVAVSGFAYQAAASRVTATAPSAEHAPTLESGTVENPSRLQRRIALGAIAAALAFFLVDRTWPGIAWPGGDVTSLAATIAVWIAFGTFADLLLLSPPRWLAVALGRGLTEFLGGFSRSMGTALAMATDALGRRSALRRLATMLTTLLIGIVAFTTTTTELASARDASEAPFSYATVLTTLTWEESLPAGVVSKALPDDVVATLESDARVVTVPAGMIVTGAEDGRIGGSVDGAGDGGEVVLVVAPTDLAEISAEGLRPVGLQDGTVTSGDAELNDLGASAVAALGGTTVFKVPSTYVEPIATREWAESVYGDVPASSLMLWPADAALSYEDAGTLMDQVLADAGAEVDGHVLAGGADRSDPSWTESLWLAIGAPVLILGVGLIVALGASSARDSRRELATLAALGASPRALRLIPALESALTITGATVVGTLSGTVASVLWNHPTLLKSGAPLDPSETLWGLGWELGHAPWIVGLGVGSVALMVAVAVSLVLGLSMSQGTPVEELRTADKEGVR
ncbi:FtsX-like permease family protein [Demequina sp. NBRC 110054]|uniref:FtsX-like permease family protein n=1 Tax=Demequina sp. NBRC 110054 TaxID=1570343 RepID=UPI000A055FCE|nr:FtsX-like permease family protein [Demequina sp. NBRC 110054]